MISDYQQMDRLLKEERNYIADICKKVAKTGCNVILLQKSILRDAITDLGLHFLSKLKIMLIRDIERDQIEFICKVGMLQTYKPKCMSYSREKKSNGAKLFLSRRCFLGVGQPHDIPLPADPQLRAHRVS